MHTKFRIRSSKDGVYYIRDYTKKQTVVDDWAYLRTPDNEAKKITMCCECGADIYEGEDYYNIEESHYCESCADFLFKKIAGDE